MRKHWVFNEHTECCTQRSENYKKDELLSHYSNICGLNHEHIVFYHLGDFFMLSMPQCRLSTYNKYQDIEDILNTMGIKVKSKLLKKFSKRRYNLDEYFEQCRKKGIAIDNRFIEVNYIYEGVGKTHSITSVVTLIDAIEAEGKRRESEKKTLQYLKDGGYGRNLVQQVEELSSNNFVIVPNEVEMVKSIENLIKTINKKTHEHK